MTNPTLTYQEGFTEDCTDGTLANWTEQGTGGGDAATMTCDNDDIFNINVTGVAGDASMYWEDDVSVAATYTKFIAKYKTSDASIKTKIVLVFTDASTQTVLAETSQTTWKTVTETIVYPVGETLDKIRLYATTAIGDVYFDWLIIRKGQFTFRHVGPGGVQVEFPMNVVELTVPGRYGGVLQNLGMKSPIITITGDVHPNEDAGATGWESATGPHFEYILDALHKDVWNWFTCDYPDISCQVMVESFVPELVVEGNTRVLKYVLKLKMYKRSSLDLATWGDVEAWGYE